MHEFTDADDAAHMDAMEVAQTGLSYTMDAALHEAAADDNLRLMGPQSPEDAERAIISALMPQPLPATEGRSSCTRCGKPISDFSSISICQECFGLNIKPTLPATGVEQFEAMHPIGLRSSPRQVDVCVRASDYDVLTRQLAEMRQQRDARVEELGRYMMANNTLAGQLAELQRQLSIAAGFHGEDLVPALTKEIAELRGENEQLKGKL